MLRNDLTKDAKSLYSESYKTWQKKMKNTSKWKVIPCTWIERLDIVKMLNSQIYEQIQHNFYQNPVALFYLHKLTSYS